MESQPNAFWGIATAYLTAGILALTVVLVWSTKPNTHPAVLVVGVVTILGFLALAAAFARSYIVLFYNVARSSAASLQQKLLISVRLPLATLLGRAAVGCISAELCPRPKREVARASARTRRLAAPRRTAHYRANPHNELHPSIKPRCGRFALPVGKR